MKNEDSGFDAGKFYDEGVEEAGIDSEEVVTDSPAQEDSTNVISQEGTEKDEVKEAAGSEQQTTETETEQAETKTEDDKKAADSSEEDIQAALESIESDQESVIESLLPKAEEVEAAVQEAGQGPEAPGQRVPVEDHIKLRQRAQRAEQKIDELQEQLETQTGGVKPGETEKSPLEKFVEENPEEELVPAKVQLEQMKFEQAQAQAKSDAAARKEREQSRAAEAKQRTADSIKALQTRALNSESAARKANTDFDEVVKTIVKANLITDAERVEFLGNKNPAQKLYEICKAKVAAIRSISGAPSKETPAEKSTKEKAPTTKKSEAENPEEDLTDEEIFEAAFPDRQNPESE